MYTFTEDTQAIVSPHPLSAVRELLLEICSNEVETARNTDDLMDVVEYFDYMGSISARVACTPKGISDLSTRIFSEHSTDFRNLLLRITDKLCMRMQLQLSDRKTSAALCLVDAVVLALADLNFDPEVVIMPLPLHQDLTISVDELKQLLVANRWLITVIIFNLLDIHTELKKNITEAK